MFRTDTVICLRKSDYSESSQIAVFFARDTGKFSAIIKGARRSRSSSGPVEILSYGRMTFSLPVNRTMATVAEFAQQCVFIGLRRNLLVINASLFAIELIGKFTTEHDPNPVLFDCLVNFLKELQKLSERPQILAAMIFFQLDLLRQVGSAPAVNRCVNCSSHAGNIAMPLAFSCSENGIVCRDCEMTFPDRIKLSPDAGRALMDNSLISTSPTHILKEIERLLITYLTFLLHKPPRMAVAFMAGF